MCAENANSFASAGWLRPDAVNAKQQKPVMAIEIRVPEAGESITQVELAKWLVADGDYVEKDQEIAEIDSDKATLTISAQASGKIEISLEEGSTTEPGKIIGRIEPAERPVKKKESKAPETDAPAGEKPSEKAQAAKAIADESPPAEKQKGAPSDANGSEDIQFSPQARKLMDEKGLSIDWDSIRPESRRITRRDVLAALASQSGGRGAGQEAAAASEAPKGWGSGSREESRQKMSTLRRKVAERLVSVKNETAMLTTFNEVDMTPIMETRRKYQKAFTEKHGIKLGFMSFFVKAVAESIPFFPQVNAYIDDNQLVVPSYADIGIAVSTPKGLMVPVIRNAEQMSLPRLEMAIGELAEKARNNKITIEDLSGGTISITNGGVFGSMLSTPILNPPQSAILGMHNIIDRPVAINGKVEIRPMMYLALSYDHRVIDGRESVSFLVKVKELVEHPERLLSGGIDPIEKLLGV